VSQAQAIFAMNRRDRQRPGRHVEPGRREKPRADDGLDDRERHRMTAGGARDHERVAPASAGTPLGLGDERQGQPVLLDRLPEGLGPGARLGGFEEILRDEVGEEPRDDVAQDRP
jgi:hypothetical protein